MPIGRVWGYQSFASNSGARGFDSTRSSHMSYANQLVNDGLSSLGLDDFFVWLWWGREDPSGQHFAANVTLQRDAKTNAFLRPYADYQQQFAALDVIRTELGFVPAFYVGPIESYIASNETMRSKYLKCLDLMEPLRAYARSRNVATPSIIIDSLGSRFLNDNAGMEVVRFLQDLGSPRIGFEPSSKVRENVAEPREQAPWHLLPNGIAVITDGLWTARIEYPAANGWFIPKSKHAGEFVIMVSSVERDEIWVAERLSEGYSVALSAQSPLFATHTAQTLKDLSELVGV